MFCPSDPRYYVRLSRSRTVYTNIFIQRISYSRYTARMSSTTIHDGKTASTFSRDHVVGYFADLLGCWRRNYCGRELRRIWTLMAQPCDISSLRSRVLNRREKETTIRRIVSGIGAIVLQGLREGRQSENLATGAFRKSKLKAICCLVT